VFVTVAVAVVVVTGVTSMAVTVAVSTRIIRMAAANAMATTAGTAASMADG
jgi:hypothetical protein